MIDGLQFIWSAGMKDAEPGSFRLGVFVEEGSVERWVEKCCRDLASVPQLSVELLTVDACQPPARVALLGWLDNNGGGAAAVERILLDDGPCASLPRHHATTDARGCLTAEAKELISPRGFDALLNLGVQDLHGKCDGLSGLGVLGLELEGYSLGAAYYCFFWNLTQGRVGVEFSLSLHENSFGEGVLLRTWTARTPSGIFPGRNTEALQGVAAVIAVELLRMAQGFTTGGTPPRATASAAPAPGTGALLGHFARSFTSVVRRRLSGDDKKLGEWFVAYRRNDAHATPTTDGPEWREFTGFEGHGAADPILIEDDGRTVLFYEDIQPPSRLGRLAGVELSPDGTPSTPFVILDKPYHLSYPNVFKQDGAYYMIPESSANRTVDLYRAVQFPQEWELDTTLVKDAGFLDTTPVIDNGVWYFFTTMASPGGEEVSLLFISDDLRGEWRLHPASPISTDVRASRAAGPILNIQGRRYRVLQVGSPRYGSGLAVHEILELTPVTFKERPVRVITPSWKPGLNGLHTFSRTPAWEAIDGRGLSD